jgi:hypothetical protein
MIQETVQFITIVQVIREMGIEPSNKLCWAVGDKMQAWYVRNIGSAPHKDNRGKTNGAGSHCFALYQPIFHKKIQEFVRQVQFEMSRQPDLFNFDGENGEDGEIEFDDP